MAAFLKFMFSFTFLGVLIFGYVNNILILINFEENLSGIGMIEVIRIIGIFLAPLGVIMGYV